MTPVSVCFKKVGGEIIGPIVLRNTGETAVIDKTLAVKLMEHNLFDATLKCIIPAMGWNEGNGMGIILRDGGNGQEVETTGIPGVVAGVLYLSHVLLS